MRIRARRWDRERFLADFYASDNNIDFQGGAVSPYDVSHVDTRYNEGLSWGRTFDDSEFAFGGYARQESLSGLGIVAGDLAEHQLVLLPRRAAAR